MKKILLTVLVVVGTLAAVTFLAIGSGLYNVAADDEHWRPVHRLIETARERSIAVRAADISVPDLDDPERARRGAGNYDSMCADCHLAPSSADTELSRGLYPRPPNLARSTEADPAQAFWVIKHGIKASGMPAWGKSMADEYIWDMVAFLKKVPTLSAEQYKAEVRASGGHSHGGGETTEEHDESGAEHEHAADGHSHDDSEESEPAGHEHAHAGSDGTEHERAQDGKSAAAKQANGPVAVVQAFHEALSSGKAAAVEKILDSKVLIMEGGNVERSRQEYASHHLPADLKFMSTVTYKLERQSGDTVGDLAWVASEARLTGQPAGKPTDLVSTESLVLRKTSAGWKIVHIHWSSRSGKKA